MNISKINNTTNFGRLSTHNSFYDTELILRQNSKTRDSYEKAFSNLNQVSGKKELEIRPLGDFGGVVVETDGRDKVLRYISKNFKNAIDCMKDAVLILQKENTPQKPRKKLFQGHV